MVGGYFPQIRVNTQRAGKDGTGYSSAIRGGDYFIEIRRIGDGGQGSES